MSSIASTPQSSIDGYPSDHPANLDPGSGSKDRIQLSDSGPSLVRRIRAWRIPSRSEGAEDRELAHLTDRSGQLQVEDVRWDMIGMDGSGRRYRT